MDQKTTRQEPKYPNKPIDLSPDPNTNELISRILDRDKEGLDKFGLTMRQVMLKNPKDNLLGTLSLLERYNSLKRCRHLIESWGSQRLKTLENCISILIDNSSLEPSDTNKEIEDVFKDLNSDAIKFQELYYLERQHINFLDKQRCGNFIAS